jgi:hypothetical protein
MLIQKNLLYKFIIFKRSFIIKTLDNQSNKYQPNINNYIISTQLNK